MFQVILKTKRQDAKSILPLINRNILLYFYLLLVYFHQKTYFSIPHSLAMYNQSKARLYRPGQTRPVSFCHFIVLLTHLTILSISVKISFLDVSFILLPFRLSAQGALLWSCRTFPAGVPASDRSAPR